MLLSRDLVKEGSIRKKGMMELLSEKGRSVYITLGGEKRKEYCTKNGKERTIDGEN